jgi:hypothetical protein
MKIFEEREWYGIDHHRVATGILVDARAEGELTNNVAIFGNSYWQATTATRSTSPVCELDVTPAHGRRKVLLTIDEAGTRFDQSSARPNDQGYVGWQPFTGMTNRRANCS